MWKCLDKHFMFLLSGKKQRRDVIDSDEDYDEDLEGFVVDEDDDFIDDSEAQDYSKYISEIFGYDKRK